MIEPFYREAEIATPLSKDEAIRVIVDVLVARADAALYRAKRAGRGRPAA